VRPTAHQPGTFTLFVYGTLKRGGCRHGPLAGQRFLGEAHTAPQYRLYDLGSYPGLVRAEDGGVVHGELYEVDRELVPLLDRLEGAPAWFDLAPVEIAGRAGPAWAYYIVQIPEGRRIVADGRWEPEGDT
jgi:gamma-glutamylaminecyclotransferase